ncbi:MAG: hypothetical protein GY868_13950 [Deltaproteobacteria bacterium]|nr:hypothetical protein [Deltaproteobacteria bacterium]
MRVQGENYAGVQFFCILSRLQAGSSFALGQSQLALSNIIMTDKSAQPSVLSTQPKMKKDIVWIKIKQWPVLVLRNYSINKLNAES